MTQWARFWAVDMHVHTPASADVKAENFGTPEDIVQAALKVGLDAIVITDHNTASWCDRVARAATDTPLIVLPGVEISTTEGHLLAIWEEGTSSNVINDVLVLLGISTADRGKLDIAANVGFASAAEKISESGGIAIAAHIEKPKGLLKLEVGAHLKRTLLDEHLCALEICRRESIAEVERKLEGARKMSYVQGSDTWDSALSMHSLSGIGARRTWVKASRPDLLGIQHALQDPDLRISLDPPEIIPTFARIESVEIVGGFLGGQRIQFSPDLNCLLGGTGAGKSLVLEAIRYALHQQVDRHAFPAVRADVDSRLTSALGDGGVVRVVLATAKGRFQVERVFSSKETVPSRVFQEAGRDWVDVDVAPTELVKLAAFSQGEILEYSRQPVGRMSLVDTGIELSSVEEKIIEIERALATNADQLLGAKARRAALANRATREVELGEQVRELSALFDTDVVKAQEGWKKEDNRFKSILKQVAEARPPGISLPKGPIAHAVSENADLFARVTAVLAALDEGVARATSDIESALREAESKLAPLGAEWDSAFEKFRNDLDAELKRVNPGSSLAALRAHLESLQAKLVDARAAKEELTTDAEPAYQDLQSRREELLQSLMDQRRARRVLRRSRVSELNTKAAGFVKLDVPDQGDSEAFRAALDHLKVGSRVREDVLEAIATFVHPIKFGRAMWEGDTNSLVNPERGIDASSVARLLANIDERELWEELFRTQLIDKPDVLTVKFRRPDSGIYAPIEALAHGQRCTAILVVLLVDGNTPVVVDQPEDALHAPWIEEYLVDRLRGLRGSRQYLFATRSPGIVVSGDAEQIVTMGANTAGHGEVEACGSLERHDLNKLVLHHLEGGPVPFDRRTRKLANATKS